MQKYDLDTPEAVNIAFEIAGIGSRFLAVLIDTAIMVALIVAVGIGCFAFGVLSSVTQNPAIILWISLSALILWGYFIFFETLWSGQTPGKRALNVRVIKRTGYPLGFLEAVTRNLVRIVDFLPALYGVGVIVMFVSPQSRRLGDYAAGTLVVRERTPVTAGDLAQAVVRVGLTSSAPGLGAVDPEELHWDLTALKSREVEIIAEYLDRAPSLDADARKRVGEELAGRIAARIGARDPLDPLAFLQRVMSLMTVR